MNCQYCGVYVESVAQMDIHVSMRHLSDKPNYYDTLAITSPTHNKNINKLVNKCMCKRCKEVRHWEHSQ